MAAGGKAAGVGKSVGKRNHTRPPKTVKRPRGVPAPQYRSCGHCISRSPCRGRGFKSNPARAALIKLALCVAAILAFYCNGLFLRVGRRVKGGKSITDNEHGESSSCLVLGRCMGGG